jgi:transcriptional regulator with XRE-family HTH domain
LWRLPVGVELKAKKPDPAPIEGDGIDAQLRRRRRELGLLQIEAAAIVGVNLWTYMNWEKGRHEPTDPHYPGICRFLGYEPWPEPITLADALRAERRRRGLAVNRAAELCRVDEGTWLRWERSEWKPMGRTCGVIDAFLGVSVRDQFPSEVR